MKFSMYFKSIDQFGAPIQLNYKKSYTLKTHIGAFLTIVAGIVAISISYVFSYDIITRSNVQIAYGKKRKESEIYLKDFPISFMFVNGNGKALPDVEKYLSLSATTLENVSNSTHASYVISSAYEVIKCNSSFYGKNEDLVKEAFLDGFTYCVKYNDGLKFENDYSSTNSTFLSIKVETCNNSTRANSEKCKSNNDITQFLNNKVYCLIQFIDTYVQPSVTDSPYLPYLFRYNQKIALNMFYRNYFRIINTKIKVDNGWIGEDFKIFNITKFESVNRDIDLISTDSSLKYTMTFESPRLGDEYSLRFIKLQTVVANIGGITSIVASILKIVCEKVSEISFYLQESKDMINFAIEEEAQEENENKDSVHYIIPFNRERETEVSSIAKGLTNPKIKEPNSNKSHLATVNIVNSSDEKVEKQNESELGKCNRIRKNDIGLLTYITTYLSCTNKNLEKKIMYDSILEYFMNKLDVTTFIKLSKEHEILKTVILGDSSEDSNEIFQLKTELKELINSHKNNLDQKKEKEKLQENEGKSIQKKLTEQETLKELNFQKKLKQRLTVIQSKFGQRTELT